MLQLAARSTGCFDSLVRCRFQISVQRKQWSLEKLPFDDPAFFEALSGYIATSDDERGHLKSDLTEDKRAQVSITEAVATEDLARQLVEVKLLNTHWRLRDMFDCLHKDLADRTPGVTYLV